MGEPKTPRIYLSVPHMGPNEETYVRDAFATNWISTVGPNLERALLAALLDDRAKKGKLPRAVVVVHPYGQSADLAPILAACAKHRVPVVEDAAEAMGTHYDGKQVGQLADVGIFSFNGNKI